MIIVVLKYFSHLNLVASKQVGQIGKSLEELLAVVVLEEDDDEELALEIGYCNSLLAFSVCIDAVQGGGF